MRKQIVKLVDIRYVWGEETVQSIVDEQAEAGLFLAHISSADIDHVWLVFTEVQPSKP